MKITLAALGIALLFSGCATMQEFSPRQTLERAPYYQSYANFSVPQDAAVGHLPVRLDEPALMPMTYRDALQPLVDSMNAYLDAAGWTVKLASAPPARSQWPWAYVGSAVGLKQRTNLGDTSRAPLMVIQALGPSRRWTDQVRPLADAQHLEGVLVIAVGPSEYYLHERRGDRERAPDPRSPLDRSLNAPADERRREGEARLKELDLGTGYRMDVEWLNAMDAPVPVLHVTGLLVARDGTVLRAGAEGIIAKRPAFRRTVFQAEPFDADELAALLTLRRDDLDGRPLAWQVALSNLVHQLLRRG